MTAIARVSWSLDACCPQCSENNDLSGQLHDSERLIAKHIFSNAWDKLAGWEVTCEHCQHEFTLERVEY